MTVRLYNTLTKRVEEFRPLQAGHVSLYCCGPTVYHFAHIGNLRTYLFEDILRRVLEASGYKVTHVMNITDVGHLQSDADDGDDKMMVAAKRENKSPWDIAKYYEEVFMADCAALGVLEPHVVCRATDHIGEMIAMVQKLEAKGYTYTVDGNVYFDTTQFAAYADFARLNLTAQQEAERIDPDPRKRNPQDFVLWFSQSKYPHQIMQWESPWGVGFPGWHIECSAMATKYLGQHFDIHCGGIDHIPVHHTNEIAQSECAHGCKWVNYWLHGEHLQLDEGKMSKSSGKVLTLTSLVEQGFMPMQYRYLCLTAHYRKQMSFGLTALEAAKVALTNFYVAFDKLDWAKVLAAAEVAAYDAAALAFVQDDLNTAGALAQLNGRLTMLNQLLMKGDQVAAYAEAGAMVKMGREVLGLFYVTPEEYLRGGGDDVQVMLALREKVRAEKNWGESDRLRDELRALGVVVEDHKDGTTTWRRV